MSFPLNRISQDHRSYNMCLLSFFSLFVCQTSLFFTSVTFSEFFYQSNLFSCYFYSGKVHFGQEILLKIFNFLKELQLHPDQEVTDEGQRFVCMLFILFGEVHRFAKARQWALNAVDSDIALTPNVSLIKLFRDWKGVVKNRNKLYVSMWEERKMLFNYKERYEHQAGYVNPYESVVRVVKEACVGKEQEHHRAKLCFWSIPTAELDLSFLLGGSFCWLSITKSSAARQLYGKAGSMMHHGQMKQR